MSTERGEASLLIELKDGTVTVRHGTTGSPLMQLVDAPEGTWDRIWHALRWIGLTGQGGQS